MTSPRPPLGAPVDGAFDEAARQIRAPWAASLAGLLFAILFAVGLILVRTLPLYTATDAELIKFYATGQDLPVVIGGLYMLPFAGIAFLWFVAVIRDQIGEREDQFFATVFLGSGIIFVATLFVATAVVVEESVGVQYLGQPAPTSSEIGLLRGLAYTLFFVFATRAGAVFLFSIASIGLRSRVFPRWFGISGYLLGIVLLVAVTFFDWVILVLPVWVAIVSLFILRRDRARRRAA